MHPAVGTECFFFHKRAFLASESDIPKKLLTVRAQLPRLSFFFSMVFPAVQPNHLLCHILLFFSFLFDFILFYYFILHKFLIYSISTSSGVTVLMRRKKYKRWHTHTTAIQILPTGTCFMQRKPIAITTVTIPMILHFVPIVMARF